MVSSAIEADTLVLVDPQQIYEDVVRAGRKLGARQGLQRLELVWRNRTSISPETAYRWLDPAAFVVEVEEALARKADWLHRARNVIAVAPIILTWLSLGYAALAYQEYIRSHSGDIGTPFIKLWQDGFGGNDPYTLSTTAIVAAVVLILYAASLVWAQEIERRARRQALAFGEALDGIAIALTDDARTQGVAILPKDADLPQVTRAIQQAITHAVDSGASVIGEAQKDLSNLLHVYRAETDRLNVQTSALVANMAQLLNDFGGQLSTLTTSLNEMAPASQNLVTATNHMASSLEGNAHQYLEIGQSLSAQVREMTASHRGVTDQLRLATAQLMAVGDTAQQMQDAVAGMNAATTGANELADELGQSTRAMVAEVAREMSDISAAMDAIVAQLGVVSVRVQQTAELVQTGEPKVRRRPLFGLFRLRKERARPSKRSKRSKSHKTEDLLEA